MELSNARLLLLSTSSGRGGSEKILARLARAERPRWGTVGVCSLKLVGAEGKLLEQEGIPVFTCALGDRRGPLGALATLGAIPRLLGIVREFQPTVVHAFLFRASLLARLPAVLGQVPRLAVSIRRLEHRSLLSHLFDRMTYGAVDRFTSVSHAAAWAIARRSGIPREQIECIPNGVEVANLPSSHPSLESWRQERRLLARQRLESLLGPLPRTLIGSAGRLEPVKGHRILLDAVSRLGPERGGDGARSAPALGVVLAGDGSERNALEKMAERTPLAGCVHFLGERADLADLLPAFDLFALPSFSEGLSNALLEAMAEGIPAVASRAGGNSEVIEHGLSGMLFESANPAALAGTLAKLLSSAEATRRLGLAGRERVQQSFSLETMLLGYRRIYQELLSTL